MVAPLPLPQDTPDLRAGPLGENPAGLAAGWALLVEAGDAVAELAQLGAENNRITPRDFAMRAAAAGPSRLAIAERMIDDCAAALHTGITALIAADEAGRDTTAAALTLWREFDRAREALLALTAPLN